MQTTTSNKQEKPRDTCFAMVGPHALQGYGTTELGYGTTVTDAGVGIGLKRGDSGIWIFLLISR